MSMLQPQSGPQSQPQIQGQGDYQTNGSGLAVPDPSSGPAFASNPHYNPQAISALVQMGFEAPAVDIINDRIVVSVAGWERTGKTHMSLTAPEPILFFDIDIGTEGVVGKFVRMGKGILAHQYRYRLSQDPGSYTNTWTAFRRAFQAACQVGVGTIIIDTWTEAYQLCRLHHFQGQLARQMPDRYAPVNADLQELIRDAYASGMNLALIQKMGWQFQRTGDTAPRQMEVLGWNNTQYAVQANLMAFRSQEPMQPGQWKPPAPDFGVTVMDCRQNPLIIGAVLTGEMANWGYLQWLVHHYQGEG